MSLDRLNHLVLTVGDLDATGDFYRRVLGMEPVRFAAGRLALRFGSQKINLHPAGPELGLKAARPTPGSGDLCFLTDEPLEVWGRHLEECRGAILPGAAERPGALRPVESGYLRDPDRHLLQIAPPLGMAADRVAGV